VALLAVLDGEETVEAARNMAECRPTEAVLVTPEAT